MRKKEVPPVAGARRRYFEAWKVRREAEATGDEPARRKGNRMLWQATSDALKAYAHPSNTEPFPPEMAFDIHVVLEDFLGGHPSPELVDDLATRGPGKSYLLREHIRLAAAYISAADRGEIPDATPKETIRRWYGVKTNTPRNWLSRHPNLSLAEALPDLPADERVEALVALVRKGGEWYREDRVNRQTPRSAK